ncbi:LppU/SCO3897 family protein [Streptomyces sp. G35A]
MTTPPPQGNPFAQGQQQPYGQPQGQVPYPPQGGFPQQAGQPGFPPPGAPVPPEQPRRKLSFKTIKNIVIAVAVVSVAIGGFIASRDDADTAAVGDCMHRGSTDDNDPDLEVVDCGSSKAQYSVLAKLEGDFSGLTAQSKCEAAAKDFQYVYTETNGSKSFLLCLKDK